MSIANSWCLTGSLIRICKSSVVRQKAESQNGCSKKTKHAKFSEKLTFLTPRTSAYWGVRNVCFLKIWLALFSWNTCFLRFALLPYYRRFFNFHIFPLMSSFLAPKVSIKLEKINPKSILYFMFNNYISTCGKLPKMFVMKISLQNKKNSEYTVFTRVSAQGAHLILGSQKKEGGRGYLFEPRALSKEALIKYIKKTSKYFRLVYFRLVIIIEA